MSNNLAKPVVMRLLALMVPLIVLGVLAFPALAQDEVDPTDEEAPTAEDPPERDGYDRPTTYPKIRFGKKKAEGAEERQVGEAAQKARVYLLDLSDAMNTKIKVEGKGEISRLEHMVAQMESSLDALAKRKDHRLRFNLVTFGTVSDFAEGGELLVATEENTKNAKEWLKELKAAGTADIYEMLSECFEQAPESATMIVGGLPAAPAKVDEAELAKYETAGEYILEQVKKWRNDGKTTTLDVTGVGLNADGQKYYKQLAEAAGGTYLDA